VSLRGKKSLSFSENNLYSKRYSSLVIHIQYPAVLEDLLLSTAQLCCRGFRAQSVGGKRTHAVFRLWIRPAPALPVAWSPVSRYSNGTSGSILLKNSKIRWARNLARMHCSRQPTCGIA